mgnify:CR=1 FL=1
MVEASRERDQAVQNLEGTLTNLILKTTPLVQRTGLWMLFTLIIQDQIITGPWII